MTTDCFRGLASPSSGLEYKETKRRQWKTQRHIVTKSTIMFSRLNKFSF